MFVKCVGSVCFMDGIFEKYADSTPDDPDHSSTYQYISSDFHNRFLAGTSEKGDRAKEHVVLKGSPAIPDLLIGVQYQSSLRYGILGLASSEAGVRGDQDSLISRLVQQESIRSRAYSVSFNDGFGSRASILFGGLDVEKFSGDLVKLPSIQRGPIPSYLGSVELKSAGISGTRYTAPPWPWANRLNVFIDTGSNAITLPGLVLARVYRTLNARPQSNGEVYVDCSLRASTKTLDFVFIGVTIRIPLRDLIHFTVVNGMPRCPLRGLQQSPSQPVPLIFGTPFLRHAYVIFDLDNKQLFMAQSRLTRRSKIFEIPAGPDSVLRIKPDLGWDSVRAAEDIQPTQSRTTNIRNEL